MAVLASGGVAVPARATDRPEPAPDATPEPAPVHAGCFSETFKGRNLQICPHTPVVDDLMARGVFIDGVPLLIAVRHGTYTSALNLHTAHDSLKAAARDAVNRLQGAALELRRGRLDPPALDRPDLPGRRGGQRRRPGRAGYVRRNVATFTSAERADFVDALLTLKDQGVYDYLVDLSRRSFSSPWNAQTHAGFVPWHRALLLLLETQIQRLKPALALPYWDWGADKGLAGAPFTTDLLGGNGYAGTGDRPRAAEVTTGPFAARTGQWPITVREDSRGYLRREIGRAGPASSGPGQVNHFLGDTVYDRAPFDTTATTELEGWWGTPNAMHNRAHTWIGGTMTAASSANDPLFYLTHAYIDSLWADWQLRHPDVANALPADLLDTPLEPFKSELNWTITPRQLLNHGAWYTYT
ncbi:tyrosinase family oxidase copper chaperone [Sinosporangium album]|uniref:tyrosinase family oxidase copper chaperone n=1 Tax=Sinosporangium album TaxID=504805 RepID=UPI000B8A348B|nr:tyrosinase family oxidase copper chaperone [Sinosporangium album]